MRYHLTYYCYVSTQFYSNKSCMWFKWSHFVYEYSSCMCQFITHFTSVIAPLAVTLFQLLMLLIHVGVTLMCLNDFVYFILSWRWFCVECDSNWSQNWGSKMLTANHTRHPPRPILTTVDWVSSGYGPSPLTSVTHGDEERSREVRSGRAIFPHLRA